jgi:TPR repeat protein
MYQFGRSVSVDIGKARQLYDQACKGGDDTGCKDLKDLDTN